MHLFNADFRVGLLMLRLMFCQHRILLHKNKTRSLGQNVFTILLAQNSHRFISARRYIYTNNESCTTNTIQHAMCKSIDTDDTACSAQIPPIMMGVLVSKFRPCGSKP